MEPSPAVEEHIRDRVAELDRLHDRITSCHVTVDGPHRHQRKGNLYAVRIDLRVPEAEIVVSEEHRNDHAHEDVYVAVRDAFDAARRQLEDHVRRRGETARRQAAKSSPKNGEGP